MAKNRTKPVEKVTRKLGSKEVYNFIDKENDINIISKEVFLKNDKVIHYPFDKRNGEPKYDFIKSITYLGFGDKLPRGVLKNPQTGYGFTSVLSPLLYFLQDKFKIETVVVSKIGTTSLNAGNKEIHFAFKDLDKIYPVISNLYAQQKKDTNSTVQKFLAKILPAEIPSPTKQYVKNTVYSFIRQWEDWSDEFSEEDVKSLADLFNRVGKENELFSTSVILKTREKIEELFIEDVIRTFQEYMTQKTETDILEETWQTFFKENNWIFSQLLSFPVMLYEDKAYVGGKDITYSNGKIADFLIQNNLTKNVAFIEIKTHKSAILKKGKAYRGNDVFPMSDDLSGAINQVLDQRDNFQKEFYSLKVKSKKPIETYNSKCVVIIGEAKGLSNEELKSFELYRSNSKDVEIVTFDELLDRLVLLQSLMTSKTSN